MDFVAKGEELVCDSSALSTGCAGDEESLFLFRHGFGGREERFGLLMGSESEIMK